MQHLVGRLLITLLTVAWFTAAIGHAQDMEPTAMLFENVRIFDGTSSALSAPSNVLVRGNKIDKIATAPISVGPDVDVTVIRGEGRTLMPGLIDAHAHLAMTTISQMTLMTSDANYAVLRAGQDAGEMLMRPMSSVRDAGGPTT